MDWSFVFPNIVVLTAYALIVWERIPRVVTALLGTSVLLVTCNITQQEAFSYIDFNVIFLLLGMMILVNILAHTGALNALAILTAKLSRGNTLYLLLILSLVTAVLSAFLDNVTTVLLIGSVTCRIAHQLGLNPVPYLVSETICSNIGGTATLIGDPPNIIIGSAAQLSFDDFLVNVAPIALIVLLVGLATIVLIYRKELTIMCFRPELLDELSARAAIKDWPLMIKALIVTVLVLLGFIFHHKLGLGAATIAMAGASVLLVFEHRRSIWSDVEWTTLLFFVGLFVMVGAIDKAGTIDILAREFVRATGSNPTVMPIALIWISGVLSAFIDNIPYTATMAPILRSLDASSFNMAPLWWALSLGACFGGNGSLVGATANVVVADMARTRQVRISFMHFLFVGGIVTIESLILSSLYIWWRYLQ